MANRIKWVGYVCVVIAAFGALVTLLHSVAKAPGIVPSTFADPRNLPGFIAIVWFGVGGFGFARCREWGRQMLVVLSVCLGCGAVVGCATGVCLAYLQNPVVACIMGAVFAVALVPILGFSYFAFRWLRSAAVVQVCRQTDGNGRQATNHGGSDGPEDCGDNTVPD